MVSAMGRTVHQHPPWCLHSRRPSFGFQPVANYEQCCNLPLCRVLLGRIQCSVDWHHAGGLSRRQVSGGFVFL